MVKESKFKKLLKAKGIKQQALADKVGVHQTRVSQWCTGDGKPSLTQAAVIAKMLNITVDDLTKCFK